MKHKNFTRSFADAFQGLLYALKSERNMVIHLVATAISLSASYLFQISRIEFLFVLSAIFLVIITEMFNTALEAAVDLKTMKKHPLALIAKSVAAGAVLCAVLYSLFVAWLVFAEKITDLW